MVLAPTHVICAVLLAFVVGKYRPVAVRSYLLAAFGALVPDFDFLPAIILGDLGWHRTYLNFWFIPFVLYGIGYFVFPKYRTEVLLFSVGYLSHIALDYIVADILVLAMIDGVLITGIVVFLLWKYWGSKIGFTRAK